MAKIACLQTENSFRMLWSIGTVTTGFQCLAYKTAAFLCPGIINLLLFEPSRKADLVQLILAVTPPVCAVANLNSGLYYILAVMQDFFVNFATLDGKCITPKFCECCMIQHSNKFCRRFHKTLLNLRLILGLRTSPNPVL